MPLAVVGACAVISVSRGTSSSGDPACRSPGRPVTATVDSAFPDRLGFSGSTRFPGRLGPDGTRLLPGHVCRSRLRIARGGDLARPRLRFRPSGPSMGRFVGSAGPSRFPNCPPARPAWQSVFLNAPPNHIGFIRPVCIVASLKAPSPGPEPSPSKRPSPSKTLLAIHERHLAKDCCVKDCCPSGSLSRAAQRQTSFLRGRCFFCGRCFAVLLRKAMRFPPRKRGDMLASGASSCMGLSSAPNLHPDARDRLPTIACHVLRRALPASALGRCAASNRSGVDFQPVPDYAGRQ